MATKSSREEIMKRDAARLKELGYKQELARSMSGFTNFAISFTIISVLAGTLTLFGFGLSVAGPSALTYGWPIVSIFAIAVAASMAEIASAYPTAGGLYYWASKLGGAGWGWFTAWFNLIGQIAVTAGIDYGLAMFVDALLNQYVPVIPAEGQAGSVATLIIYAVILIAQAFINSRGINLVSALNNISAWWHICGVILIVGVLLFFAPHHANPLSFMYNTQFTATGFPYWYGFLLGLLVASYTFTGYDASAHVSEETEGSELSAPRGILMSVVVSAIAGYLLIIGFLVAMPDLQDTLGSTNAVLYILTTRLGGTLGTLMFLIAIVAQFFCGTASITSNSRMIFAFARDGGMPYSKRWYKLSDRHVPLNALYLSISSAFILALPALFSTVVYSAVTSIAVIGLYIAYVTPVFLKNIHKERFTSGPWTLGAWSPIIGWTAILWTVFGGILFMLPVSFPITVSNFNFTGVVLLIVWVLLIPWYLLSVRHWFRGPKSAFDDLGDLDADTVKVGSQVSL
ncbi:amino acid permease [Desulfosporosinus sp. PR]|uniref:amino acid permease n=1 Tax=Candidatus Desulfosporosinus nitrosoreducens TaxID=3401928 RepID=UPI0027F67C46|nr:amino acid permease [Desulfosporosinus sp. PR]MDQ7092430.1 amino acid permease [Desulfosporosinus sp. PR]